MNTFGDNFRVSVFGESHGAAIGVVMDGVPPGMPVSAADFLPDLERRRAGRAGTTARMEADIPEILSGVLNGMTTGAPLAVIFRNGDVRPEDYDRFKDQPRPSHADWTAARKYLGCNDYRGGGHFSGRVTLAIVAAGVVAKKILANVVISAEITEIGGCSDPERFVETVLGAQSDGDSVGGVVECRAEGVGAGWGEPFFDSVESVMAHILFAIPAVKGVEFGAGFASARMAGSQNNDPLLAADGKTATNNSGGINGGITNGNTIVVRVAVKPTPSIAKQQMTFDFVKGEVAPLGIGGRHDACIALRMPVIVEAAVAIALAQFK